MWLIALVAGSFALGALLGAPYLPSWRRDTEDLLDIAQLQPGQKLLDLGSGDGRILLAAAARGISAVGYEINPLLYLYSRWRCWRYRRLIKIKLADFWREDWPSVEVIYVFLIKRYMTKLDRKLKQELQQSTKVVSYIYPIPGQTPTKTTRNAYLYNYPKAKLVI